MFFSIIYAKDTIKSHGPFARTQMLNSVAAICFSAFGAATLLAGATGSIPRLPDGQGLLTIADYASFTTAAALGCVEFTLCIAQTFSCVAQLLDGDGRSPIRPFFPTFLVGSMVLLIVLETGSTIAQAGSTIAQARMVEYHMALISPPVDMFRRSLACVLLPCIFAILVRYLYIRKLKNPLAERLKSVDRWILPYGSVLLTGACMFAAAQTVCTNDMISNTWYRFGCWIICAWLGVLLAYCMPFTQPVAGTDASDDDIEPATI